MNIKDEWRKKQYFFPNPAKADEFIIDHVQRLNERLDSVEKALGTLLDKLESQEEL